MRKDFLYALRNMAANPLPSALIIATLALGLGANTAIFSVVNAVLLRPLPYREPDRLVTILARIPRLKIEGAHVEYNNYAEWWRDRAQSFESMAAFTPKSVNLTSGDEPQRVRAMRVSATFFSVIGTKLAIGRDFRPEEDQPGAPQVAVLANGLWKRRFAGDPGIVGKPIVLDGSSYDVVGVLPANFAITPEEIFIPIAQSTARDRNEPTVGTYARLKPGVTIASAQAEIDGINRAWSDQYHYPKDWGARVWPVREFQVRNVKANILVLAAAVCLVLLIACVNVANLLLSRAAARQREIAIRSALGAQRGRIVRQLLTESLALGIVSALAGLLVAWGLLRIFVTAGPAIPFSKDIALNAPVLGFTLAAALLTSLLFGLAPAMATMRAGLVENLKEGGRGAGESVSRSRFRGALVVAEIGLAVLLVIGSALTLRSLARLQAVDPGFNPDSVLTADITLPASKYEKPAQRVSFYQDLLQRLAAAPGVTGTGMVTHLPFSGSKSGHDIVVEGAPAPRPGEQKIVFVRVIDPDYFRAMQVRLVKGRFFTQADPAGPPVAIINETLARRCWPNQDPVGKRFGSGRPDAWLTVVGVTSDMRNTSLALEPDMEYFVPHRQQPSASMALVVRSGADSLSLASTLRAAVRELDKDLPVSEVVPLSVDMSRANGARRLSVVLFSFFALLALLLASVGIYGVVSYTVGRRTGEIGVRMAMGASAGRIAGMVLGRSLGLGLAGVAAGIAAALTLTRLLESLLFGVSATDPSVFAASAFFLLAVTAAAAYIPARRAAHVDPVVALRQE